MRARATILATVAAGTSLVLHALMVPASQAIRIPIQSAPPSRVESEAMVVFEPTTSDFTIGEAGAKGYASHKVAGDREAVSPEAPVDQAALSLDPVGPDLVVEKPQDAAGDAIAGAAALPSPIALPSLAQLVESAQARLPQVVARLEAMAAAAEAPPPASQPAIPARSTAAVSPPGPAMSVGGKADPAPLSDSESDAFSVLGSAQYRDGRLSVRAGRKVRSRRPKIGLAGQVDLYQRRVTRVTLRVSTDADGKVTGVEVVRSSGSNEIDQPCRVAMYDWWFEPRKDAAGKPVPDVFDFTIGFH